MDTCKEILDLLSDYLDGEMPPDRSDAFEHHMEQCPPCLDFLDSVRATRSLASSLRCDEIPEEVQRSLRAFLGRETRGGKP